MRKLEGVIPPMVTLFNNNKEIDWTANRNLVNYLIKKGIDGIFVLGSLGEFTHLTVTERKKYIKFIVEEVNNRVPVLVGVGHTSTDIAIELSKDAQNVGADYLVVVTPYYWELDDEAIINHYQKVAEATDLPIIIYNYPDLTGINMGINVIKKIVARNDNVVGIKDTIDSLTHIHKLINKIKTREDDFSVLVGLDNYFLSGLIAGADGMIGGSANFIPRLGKEIFENFQSGKLEEAAKKQQKINILSNIYSLANPPISIVKEAINLKTPLNVSNIVRSPALKRDLFAKNKLEELLLENK
ncbi:dihydrodipicolinate synthase family protein [Halanaerobacter jeridensis]|uniref:4-hydroxy-tetrahydrodipicolinate synthase n=1 Tax=Halanaerobacter jeridensis TaxID=706427 RepID=A0A938XST9_9FIRM|nr:dihydrodipicolinate synthase family protein [Halanaerobacter jeridensis]MBM7556863.1 4-hydroxy-tetrahydrodipicolinate synthase [Halanaerobacter jeridensis]